jgi:hypothetical protein
MKKSILDELKEYQKKISDFKSFNSHFMVGVDLTEDGIPHASMMISRGKPFETVGMIDILVKNLKDKKKEILNQHSQKKREKQDNENSFNSQKINNALKHLPKGLRDKITDLKKRLDLAYENSDEEALNKIKEELENLKNPDNDYDNHDDNDDDDDNFNITDFKGGLA